MVFASIISIVPSAMAMAIAPPRRCAPVPAPGAPGRRRPRNKIPTRSLRESAHRPGVTPGAMDFPGFFGTKLAKKKDRDGGENALNLFVWEHIWKHVDEQNIIWIYLD